MSRASTVPKKTLSLRMATPRFAAAPNSPPRLWRYVVPVRPNLSPGGSVQRRDSAGRLRHEHDPAPHNRRDLDGRGLAVDLVNPSEGELVHILTVDLTQGAVAGRPVRAGVGEPVLGRLACRRKLIV